MIFQAVQSAKLLLVLSMLCLCQTLAFAENPSTNQQLRRVQQQIQQLQQTLVTSKKEYSTSQQQLEQQEKNIGRLATELVQLEQRYQQHQQRLSELEPQRQQQQQHLQQQRESLVKQIRAAYIMGHQDYLKILLNQQEPDKIGRVLTYYDYFNRVRSEKITKISNTLEHIQVLEGSIQQENIDIKQLTQQRQTQKKQLELSHQARRELVKTLADVVANKQQHIQLLSRDEQHLRGILGIIDTFPSPSKTPSNPSLFNQLPFNKLKGKLTPPVSGSVLHRYGTRRKVSGLTWRGILFAAQKGEPVRSVATGQVVFADWLRNFGQLLIIRHSKHYMTLYGHNQSLYKKTGDTINANEIIATAGQSGGLTQPALYFEIRYRGVAKNPAVWLVR